MSGGASVHCGTISTRRPCSCLMAWHVASVVARSPCSRSSSACASRISSLASCPCRWPLRVKKNKNTTTGTAGARGVCSDRPFCLGPCCSIPIPHRQHDTVGGGSALSAACSAARVQFWPHPSLALRYSRWKKKSERLDIPSAPMPHFNVECTAVERVGEWKK